jgi:hypothetical protein
VSAVAAVAMPRAIADASAKCFIGCSSVGWTDCYRRMHNVDKLSAF